MDSRTAALLTGGITVAGAVVLLGLVVSPFDYGLAESAVLVGAFVFVAWYRTILDEALSAD